MTQTHLDFQQEPSSSDITTQPLFNDSPVLLLKNIDQVNAHPSEEVEQIDVLHLQNFILLLIPHMKYHRLRKNAMK